MSSEGSTSLRRWGNPAGGKECKPHFSKGMSPKSQRSQKSQLPPFLCGGNDNVPVIPVSQAGASTEKPKDPQTDHASKKARITKDGGSVPIPKPPANANVVHHLFAKLGNQHATEAEVHDWCNTELDENANALTKCLAEAFIRQVSHVKDFKHVVSTNAKLEKENTILKFQMEEEKRALNEAHKLTLKTETAKLRQDLKNATAKVTNLEKSLQEAEKLSGKVKENHEKEIATLNNQLEIAKFDREALEEEYVVLGQVVFMKTFIQKVPDFDWDRLGPGNAEYAATLRQEIEDEAHKEAEEVEATRLASEADLEKDFPCPFVGTAASTSEADLFSSQWDDSPILEDSDRIIQKFHYEDENAQGGSPPPA